MASASHKEAVMAKWTEPLNKLFVSLLVEEVRKGNRTTSTYNKAGWNNILVEFNKQTGLHLNLIQLKNRANKMKKQYGSFKKLLSQSGFGWDNVNKTIVVEDPSVWESHIKDHSEWAKFRKGGFPEYPNLCIVFGDTYATGDHAARNSQYFVPLKEDDMGGGGDNGGGGDGDYNGDANEVGDSEDFIEHHIDEGVFAPDVAAVGATLAREKHKLDRTPNSKRRRKSNSFAYVDTYKAIQDLVKLRTSEATTATTTSITSQAPQPTDPYSVASVVTILNAMPELETSTYNKAVNQACLQAPWRKAFITSLPERRIGLLYSL